MTTLVDELEYYKTVDLPIYQREFADWLPARVFDVHTHLWLEAHNLKPISEERVGLVFEASSVSREELEAAYALLYPGKQVECLGFGMPLSVIDREANNQYVGQVLDNERVYGLYVPALDADAESLHAKLLEHHFVGFKPYLSYVTWKGLEDIRIRDFVTDAQLEVANRYRLPIMLHVPREGRIADRDNLADLDYIGQHYPDAQIILAHGGRAYSPEIIYPALDRVVRWPNLSFELSNVQSAGVVQAILERMPLERIMFGTDIPVATVRGYMFMLNGQRICLTRKQFPWSISSAQPGKLRCTFMGYEQLRAIRQACDTLKLDSSAVEKLFYGNARALVTSALQSLTRGVL